MKKVLLVAGLVVCLAAIPIIVLAQITPDPQSSHTLIQNLSANEATVVVDVYNANTEALETSDTFTIAGYGATTVHATAGTNAPGHRYLNLSSGFLGSMVVSSNQEVVAINLNAGGSPFTNYSAYESVDPSYAADAVFVPSIHWRAGQWSLVSIQNTGSVNASVAYTYTKQDGSVISSGSATIQPGRAEVRNTYDDIDIGTVTEGVGAMLVTSDEPVGVAIIETLQTNAEAYLGFPVSQGDTVWYLPSVHHHPQYLQTTHMLVQNMDPNVAAAVELTYYHQDGSVANYFTSTIPANGSLTYHTTAALSADGKSYEPTNLGLVGSAVIESDRDVVVVGLEVLGPTSAGRPYAYRGFNGGGGGTDLLLPSVHNNPAGQFSHMLVMNLDDANTNQVRLEYIKQDGNIDSVYTTTLPASGALTFHTNGNPSSDGYVYDASSSYGNVGAARVMSLDGRPLVAVNIETLRGAQLPACYAAFSQ
jgi:hypothetical protein